MGIKQRLDRLEGEMGLKQERRVWIITTLPFEEDDHRQEQTPYRVEIFPGLWAYAARGGPFTSEEIRRLKEKYKAEYEEFRAKERFHEQA